jgi:hypothetical protein
MSEEQDSDQETQDDGWDEGNGSISCAPGADAESPDLQNNEPINISWHHTRSLRGDLRLSPTKYERIVKARSSYNVQLADTDRAASDNGYDDGLEYDEFLVMSTAERDVRAAFRRAACAAEGRYHDEKSTSTVIELGLQQNMETFSSKNHGTHNKKGNTKPPIPNAVLDSFVLVFQVQSTSTRELTAQFLCRYRPPTSTQAPHLRHRSLLGEGRGFVSALNQC